MRATFLLSLFACLCLASCGGGNSDGSDSGGGGAAKEPAFDAKGAELLLTLPTKDNASGCLAFSPDGKILATEKGTSVQLWSMPSGEKLRDFGETRASFGSLAFSPDGKHIASDGDGLHVWEVESGKQIHAIRPEGSRISAVDWSPDGKTIATGGDKVRLWNAESGELIKEFDAHQKRTSLVHFSPDGETLATCEFGLSAKLWNVESGDELQSIKILGASRGEFLPDGSSIVFSGLQTKVYDAKSGDDVQKICGTATDLDLSPDGTIVATAKGDVITLYAVASGDELRSFDFKEKADWVGDPMFSPDGELLAISVRDQVHIYGSK